LPVEDLSKPGTIIYLDREEACGPDLAPNFRKILDDSYNHQPHYRNIVTRLEIQCE
jgi:hypothetical protein